MPATAFKAKFDPIALKDSNFYALSQAVTVCMK